MFKTICGWCVLVAAVAVWFADLYGLVSVLS